MSSNWLDGHFKCHKEEKYFETILPGQTAKYISSQTGKLWSEEQLSVWIEDFYGMFESNVQGFVRPQDVRQRTIKVLYLEIYDQGY